MLTRPYWTETPMPALGLGCWAIGGPFTDGGSPRGWGEVDDKVSAAAIAQALDFGIRFFDTAQAYGCGQSEKILGTALAGHPHVRIATKVGYGIDPVRREMRGLRLAPADIRAGLEASRTRLQRDRIDLVLLHDNDLSIAMAEPVFDELGRLRDAGWIDKIGWSTDHVQSALAFCDRPGFVAIEHGMNVFSTSTPLVPVLEARGLTGIIRSPLAMGLLGGKYSRDSSIADDDVRGRQTDFFAYFKEGRVSPEMADRLDAVRELLRAGGRSLAQGAIGWLWARSDTTMPIPGFRTPEQVKDLCGALEHGPLQRDVMLQIDVALASFS